MIHLHLLELELLTLWSRLWSFHTSLPWPSRLPFVFVVFEASLYLLCPHGRSSCYAMSSGRLGIAFLPVAPSCPLHIYIVETSDISINGNRNRNGNGNDFFTTMESKNGNELEMELEQEWKRSDKNGLRMRSR